MSVIQLVVAIAALAVAGGLLRHFSRKADLRRVQRFADRPMLPMAELYKTYYSDSDLTLEVVEQALRAIENATRVPGGRLRPEDTFQSGLAPERGWEFDDGLAELRWLLQSLGVEESTSINTVDDFVRSYGGALQRRDSPMLR
jgi:hypothetical protein